MKSRPCGVMPPIARSDDPASASQATRASLLVARTFARPWARGKTPTHLRRRWCAFRLWPFFKCSPLFLFPALDSLFIALARPLHRFLHTLLDRTQDAATMRRVITDGELPLDHLRDPLSRPHVSTVAIRL